MRVLITADWHVTSNPRDAYRWDFVENTLLTLIEEEGGIDLLLLLGDLTEAKAGHSAELVNRLVTALRLIADLCPIVIVQGNHDGLTAESPFFKFVAGDAGNDIYWVGRPTSLNQVPGLSTGFAGAARTLLLPNTRNYERDWAEIDFKTYDWAFAHQAFAGASSESGFKLSGIPLSYFPKNLQIVAGDIHKPQTLGPLTYVGSPYTIDFGDDFKPRVLMWDGENLTSMPVDGPQKQLITAASLKELTKADVTPGDIVQVRLAVDDYEAWPEAKAALEAWAAKKGVVLHAAKPVIAKATGGMSLDKPKTLTDEEILRAYAKKNDVNDAYVTTGLRFL